MKKKMTSTFLAVTLCVAMLAGCANATTAPVATETTVGQPTETFNDVPLEEVTIAKESPDYYKAAFEAEYINFKFVRSLPTAYSAETWKAYADACSRLPFIDPEKIDAETRGFIDACIAAREALVQVQSFADSAWYIWGDSIPCAEDVSTLEFTTKSWDYPEFKPFLVPYLLEDQSAVKGNLIVVAGGGYSQRSNTGEGYPVAARFNELGYNCYVLQRRVAPYSGKDVWMDMQRSIRYLRYNAEQKGLGGMDNVLAVGFSGGGATIGGTIVNCYGDVQPTIYDAAYHTDAVDQVNSDLDVALIIYGPNFDFSMGEFKGYVTENENLPAVFIAAGANDNTGAALDCLELYKSLDGKTLAELHIFGNGTHGFGLAQKNNNTSFWVPMADGFVDLALSLRDKEA